MIKDYYKEKEPRVYVRKAQDGYEVTICYYTEFSLQRKYKRMAWYKTKVSAEKKKAEIEVLLKEGCIDLRPRELKYITLGECIEGALRDEKRRRRNHKIAPGTYKSYEGYYKREIEFDIGKRQILDLKPSNIQKFIDRKATKFSYEIVYLLVLLIRKGILYAIEKEYMGEDITQYVRVWSDKVPAKTSKENYLTIEQFKHLLENTEDPELRLQIMLAGFLGLRISEVLGMGWDEIDLDRKVIKVERIVVTGLKGRPILQDFPKGKKALIVSIPEMLEKELREFKILWDERRKLTQYFKKEKLLFYDTKERPLYTSTVSNRFKRLATSLGYDHITFHGLRHTYATLLYDMEFNLEDIAKALNHTNANNITRVYTHFTDNKRDKVRNAVDLAFSESK